MRVLPLLLIATSAVAAPKKEPPKKDTAEQKDADKHFKAGVALYKEAKFTEALAEFERAYEIAPHPLVLNNIAACHRELSQYGEAVKYYRRFLDEGKGKVPPARLTEAKKDLDDILARIASITITSNVDGAKLTLDGNELGTTPLDGPLMVPPGEHKLVARAAGKKDAERSVRVASGDKVDVKLELADAPAEVDPTGRHLNALRTDEIGPHRQVVPARKRFAVGAAFGTNLMRVSETGAPSLSLAYAPLDRLEIGIDAIFVAYAVMPSVRVRIIGDQLALHAAVAVPIAFTDGTMSETFVAGAVGLGVRYRPMPMIAFRLESFAAIATNNHGLTLPAFLGGEVWF